ncbi:MAG TPA: CHASE domain-containing protein [Bryobacteraceae bacterium]|nr:CHASE domain-containing protein [Bryobacteraceae bacterium]
MPTTTTLARRRNAVALITGIVNLLVGITVLAGYAFQESSLVTLLPGSAPMRLTTAVATLCCGAAVLLLAGGYLKVAAGCAVICGVIGSANLVEAIAGFHIAGFDPVAFAGGAPPRAGTLIACLLILAAAALILMSGAVRLRARLAIVGFIGSVLHSVGVVAVISYIADVSSAFTTGPYSQLSVHTAVTLAALGAALIRFAWRDSMAGRIGAPAWVPLLVGVATLTTSFCLYGAMAADQESDFAHQLTFEAEGLRQFINAGLDNRIQPLIRLARHRAAVPDLKKEDWDADTQMILTRGGYQSIEWIDPAGKVVWTAPPGAGDATPDGSAAFEPRRQAAFDAARQNRGLAASRPIDLVTGGKGTIVLVPVFVRDELAGYIAGVFRYQLLFQNVLSSNPSPRYSIAVHDGKEFVFSQGSRSRSSSLFRTAELVVGGARWKLEIGPTEALVLQARSPAGGALLVAGVFLAVLFTLMVYLVERTGTRQVLDQTMAAQTTLTAPLKDAARLPVVSYGRDGTLLAWNDTAKLLFTGAPPRIPACETGFHTIYATLLRASASPVSLDALRLVLDSCSQPALLFDAEGRFVAANPASARTLGWSDESWSGRNAGTLSIANPEALEIHNVLLMQGQWATPASGHTAAATAQ